MDVGGRASYITIMPLLILLFALVTALTGAIGGVRAPDVQVERVQLTAVAQAAIYTARAATWANPALIFATVVTIPTMFRARAPFTAVLRYSDRRRE